MCELRKCGLLEERRSVLLGRVRREQLYKEVGYETIFESKLLEVNLVLENTTAETKQIVMSDM